MVIVSLTESFGQSVVIKLIEFSLRWLNGPQCNFTSEAVEYFNKFLQRSKSVIPMIILLHQGFFHITGRYPTIAKRLFKIDYAKVM